MIIALLALALAMIVGGLLTAFFGWDIVLVERGWTMVIAGSVMAASGALLLGITAAVSKLAKIEARLSQLRGGVGEAALQSAPKGSGDLSLATLSGGLVAGAATAEADEDKRPDEAQPTLPLFEEEGAGEEAKDEVRVAAWPDEPRATEPVVPFPPRTSPTPVPMPDRDEDEPDLKVPDFLLADRDRDTDEEPRVVDGADLYQRDRNQRDLDERVLEPRDLDEPVEPKEPVVEPVVADDDAEPDREHAEAADAAREDEPDDEAASDEPRPPVVVGTYNSGDNKYVMFSDGSIEAQTPSGVFRFKSLDELKEFIAAGGEGNSSSAT
ncbi:hypothetical protein HPT29_017440 [Microvirga terrae]|uniref:DUF308 domain-containing protein n=1 Tax=Microvirga terrae TaxID=2740529 RepID=A0ABY5RM46_9HYPH|nr:hypothetical protein [Microvirga terrae]UVF18285.1 hypothetical protein HPT29_017440 [Microvirga terrae]